MAELTAGKLLSIVENIESLENDAEAARGKVSEAYNSAVDCDHMALRSIIFLRRYGRTKSDDALDSYKQMLGLA
jgi:uncharacterized protein (UPF0335 family)